MLPNKINPTPVNPDNVIYIFNLSTIHQLAPLNTVLDNFAKLHYDYAKAWLHFEWVSKLWVNFHAFKMTGPINDFKLGKINSKDFIKKLQEIFYFLPPEESTDLLKNAWNSLIVWDEPSSQRLKFLIETNQPVNLISNSNELHIQKIKQAFDNVTERTWDWHSSGECHFQVSENFRLMTSYENGILKTDGLLENLVAQLVSEGQRPENISLISQYQADLDKAKALGINRQKPNQFFPNGVATTLTSSPLQTQAVTLANADHSDRISLQGQAKSFFAEPSKDNLISSETTPLVVKPKP